MNWHALLAAAGGLLALAAIVPYVRDILRGTTRPNAVSYSIWAFLILIAIGAQISAGTSWSIVMLVGDFIGTSTVVVLCWLGYGYKRYGPIEWICFGIAIIAVVAWQLARQPVLAISFAIVADAMAAIPTLVKAYRDPWSEHPDAWLIVAVGALLSIFSSTIFNAANLLFPSYLLVVNGTTGILALVGRRVTRRPG